jgi:hypothetical protein
LCLAELCLATIWPVGGGLAEVRPDKVRLYVRTLLPPLIPGSYPLVMPESFTYFARSFCTPRSEIGSAW